MGYNPDRHNRHSIRLRGYDYTTGAYFVTICLNWRIPKILRNVQQNDFGRGQIDLQQKGQTLAAKGQTRRSAPTDSVTVNHGFDFPTFGVVENGVMVLNDCGKMIEKYILEIVNNTGKFSNIKIDEYIVMPDHIHAIITINDPSNRVGADLRVCPCETKCCPCATKICPTTTPIQLGTIIQWFKTMTTNEYTANVKTINWRPFHKRLWERNYYERIIRDDAEYARIAKYIRNNPISWRKEH